MRCFWYILLLFLPLSAMTQVTLRADVNQDTLLIGDQITLTLTATSDPSIQLVGFDLQRLRLAEVPEILQESDTDTISRGPKRILEKRLRLTVFDSGRYVIPSLGFEYRRDGQLGRAETAPIPLFVQTIPISSDTIRLQPIKGIMKEPIKLQDVLLYLLVVIAAGLLISSYFLYRNWKNRPAMRQDNEPALPSHELALQRLQELRERGLLEQGAYKYFQSELTYILRAYIQDRFQIKALDATTDQIIHRLQEAKSISGRSDELRQMLQTADLVKFAKASPPHAFHTESWNTVKRFIEETRAAVEDTENSST